MNKTTIIFDNNTQKYLSKQIRGSCMCANVWMNER